MRSLFTRRTKCHNHKFCTEFRPRIGDYFLSRVYDVSIVDNPAYEFPSPYWGLIFYAIIRNKP